MLNYSGAPDPGGGAAERWRVVGVIPVLVIVVFDGQNPISQQALDILWRRAPTARFLPSTDDMERYGGRSNEASMKSYFGRCEAVVSVCAPTKYAGLRYHCRALVRDVGHSLMA